MIDPAIRKAVSTLKKGGVIAYPTEAVFGLGCDPRNTQSLKKILNLKQRSILKGFILVASDMNQLSPYIKPLNRVTMQRMEMFQSGPITWLLPARIDVPLILRGAHDKIAVRVTRHPSLLQLCQAWGGALVSTSANPRAQCPARTAQKVMEYFNGKIDYVLKSKLGQSVNPSEIRDAETGYVVRPA